MTDTARARETEHDSGGTTNAPDSARTHRRPRPMLLAAAVVGVVTVLLVALLATREPAVNKLADSPLLGRPAPEITGETIDGEPIRLSTMRGQYVVVNFFATWCVPCQREHPQLTSFQERHAAAGDATVLMVIFDDTVPRVRRFFEREGGGGWPVVHDPRGRVALEYGVFGPPESFVVDPNGYVIAKVFGEVTADGLEQVIAEHEERLAGRA